MLNYVFAQNKRKKRRSAPRSQILNVKVCHFSDYKTCYID